jgi:hypothetical protein
VAHLAAGEVHSCQVADITKIHRLGISCSFNNWKSVSIARAPSVALLDTFIGPKT